MLPLVLQAKVGFAPRDLRTQAEDLLNREASGEVSEEEFHYFYDKLLRVHSQDSLTVRERYQEGSQNIFDYEVEFEPFISE